MKWYKIDEKKPELHYDEGEYLSHIVLALYAKKAEYELEKYGCHPILVFWDGKKWFTADGRRKDFESNPDMKFIIRWKYIEYPDDIDKYVMK